MADHNFHIAIGNLITPATIKPENFPESELLTIHKDHACDPTTDGQIIALYRTISGEIELCNVDMLIEVGGKAKVIIEIEESDVTPVHVFGKFFASAFCDRYKTKGSDFKRFSPKMFFIQILEWSVNKQRSLKPRQWDHISVSIGGIKTARYQERDWNYRIIYGPMEEFSVNRAKGKELVSTIMYFLEKKL